MNNKISAGILGLGSYMPEKILTNFDLEKMVDTSDEWIRTRTGISERRIADPNDATSDMATRAALKALDDAGVSAADIDMIIVATITPDMIFPATACIVQDNIGAKNAAAFDLEAACSGFIYGLSIAKQFIETGTYRYVLVIAADILSRITDWQDRNTCVLFGDGAGAAVVGPVEEGYGILSTYLGSDGSGGKYLHIKAGGSRMPASHETVDKRLHYMYMDGGEVFKFAVKIMDTASMEAIERAGLKPDDIDWFVPHQANIRIIESARRRLGISPERVCLTIHKYGNMSAATIPVTLDEAAHEDKFKKGDNIVLVGFGGGLTWASCVLKWSK
ncbi:MAG: 3-oxoacyl-[acyl-carrier-protein] synthase [Clostridiales bacterium]|nr:3-oxoacyl-[acyl-carrier-protein] synthase [Clostridiales bacterium]